MQEKDNLRDLLGNKLRDFEATPPSGMWDRIESGLQRRKRRILLYRYGSIAASILLLIGLAISYLNSPDKTTSADKQFANNEGKNKSNTEKENTSSGKKATGNTKSATNPDKQNSTLEKENSTNNKNSAIKGASSDQNTSKKTTPAIKKPVKQNNQGKNSKSRNTFLNQTNTGQLAETETPSNGETYQAIEGFNTDEIAVNPQVEPILAAEPVLQPQQMLSPEELAILLNPPLVDNPEEKTSGGDYSLGLAYAVSSGADFTKESAALTEGGREYSYDEFSASIANGTSYFEEVENAIHDAPLSIGFIMDKGISKRLSFETGIIYTRLKFKVKTNELDPFYREYRNELNYLGIPAGIRYSFIQKKKYDFYALQWIVLEKGISGTWFTDTYNNDELVLSESARSNIRGFQLSTVTGIGGQMKIAGKFYLFGQGGAQIFYLNNTQPYNLRSTKKIWPSFQAGLRMKISE